MEALHCVLCQPNAFESITLIYMYMYVYIYIHTVHTYCIYCIYICQRPMMSEVLTLTAKVVHKHVSVFTFLLLTSNFPPLSLTECGLFVEWEMVVVSETVMQCGCLPHAVPMIMMIYDGFLLSGEIGCSRDCCRSLR